MSWDWIMSIDPHWFSTLFGWYVVIKFLCKWYHCDCISYCVLKSKGYLEHVNTSHIHDLQNLCLVLVFSGLIFGFTIYVDMVCK
jgi:hypothetical protein